MSAKPGQPKKTEQEEMLPQDPPPSLARWTAWLLLGLFAAITVAAVTIRVPETVRCPFVLVPENGADPVQSSVLGIVQAVRVHEGQTVDKGGELLVIRSDEIRSWQTELQTCQQDLKACLKRGTTLDDYFASQLGIKDEELKQVERDVVFRQKHLDTSLDFLARNKKLAAEKLISEVELLRHELEVAESEKDLNVAQRSVQQVTLQRRQIETERARQKTEEEAEREKYQVRIDALNRRLENCSGDVMTVRAPYPCAILSLTHRAPGAVVHNGDELCQLARLEPDTRVQLSVNQAGLARLTPHQTVRLFFDSFPFQRYGTLTGKLEWISPAAVTSSDGTAFTARAVMDKDGFSAGGRSHPLRVGMRGEARIIVGARTPLQYLLEPIRALREQTRR